MLPGLPPHKDGPFLFLEEIVFEDQPTLLDHFISQGYLPRESAKYFHEKDQVSSPEDQGCNSAIRFHRITDYLRFAGIS